jgi:hypothetical protein
MKFEKESVMKTKKIALIFCVVLLCGGTFLYAKSDSTEERARIGILLDNRPLPDLLVKHLRLEPGQGIRISNVQQNSPADKAGLERDDIIIGFEDEKIKSLEQLVDAVQEAGVGAEVSLEIIHLGQRKTVELQLEALKGEHGWKYPSEPEIFQSWRPGRMFRLKPGDNDWMEIELPFDEKSLEVYDYHHSGDGEDYSITIEGNPDDEDSKITVRIGSDEYKTTIGEIDKLPEKYREVAQDALKKSQKHSEQRKKIITRKFDLPSMFKSDELSKYLDKIDELNKHLRERSRFHVPQDLPKFGPDNKMFDKIEEQMRKLQERVEELEKRFKETPGRPSRETDKDQI